MPAIIPPILINKLAGIKTLKRGREILEGYTEEDVDELNNLHKWDDVNPSAAEAISEVLKNGRRDRLFRAGTRAEANLVIKEMQDAGEAIDASLVTDWGFDKLTESLVALEALIDSDFGKEVLKAVDRDGWGLLHLAVFANSWPLVTKICDRGSEKDYPMVNKANDAGETAFGLAVRLSQTAAAKRIARHKEFRLSEQNLGAPGPFGVVLSIDFHPCGPLWRLAAAKSIEEARVLANPLDLKMVVLARDFGFQVINYHAVQAVLEKMRGDGQAVKGENGHDLNIVSMGWNILQHAVFDQRGEVVRLLLQHKPAMNLAYDNGTASGTVLHTAVQKGYGFAVEAILERMEDDSLLGLAARVSGITPREVARDQNNPAILKMIEDFDAAVSLAKSTNIAECRKVVDGLKDGQKCSVCIDRGKNSGLPCGHVFCGECIKRFSAPKKCPNCKKPFAMGQVLKLFM